MEYPLVIKKNSNCLGMPVLGRNRCTETATTKKE